jgi:hypothetical protein
MGGGFIPAAKLNSVEEWTIADLRFSIIRPANRFLLC